MSATTFSPVFQFRNGQYVTAVGENGIAEGWMKGRRGRSGHLVAVRFTSGKKAGKTLGVRPANVTPRKGRNGSGALPRIS